MKCFICKKGETEPGKVTVTLERGGTTLIIRNVPAEVCLNCGEEYVDEATTSKILRDAEKTAQAGTLVDIREYIAA